ncbi:MAG TPA: hypothetical protein VER79_04950 [Candidatus Limnocylindrales bacterium]|nr:hypothetical protein [Candidatus Limnocylindrales bacterium]
MIDQQALVTSQAGMRLVAILTLFNKGDFARLRAYLREHYTAPALEANPAAARLAELRLLRTDAGRQRLRQVVGVEKHRVIALVDAESGGLFIHELTCEEDYPHKVTAHYFTQIADKSAPPQDDPA